MHTHQKQRYKFSSHKNEMLQFNFFQCQLSWRGECVAPNSATRIWISLCFSHFFGFLMLSNLLFICQLRLRVFWQYRCNCQNAIHGFSTIFHVNRMTKLLSDVTASTILLYENLPDRRLILPRPGGHPVLRWPGTRRSLEASRCQSVRCRSD